MKIRHAAALLTLAAVASFVVYQAVTARPPEPYVRLYSGLPEAPWIRAECRRGKLVRIYTGRDGAETDIEETDVAC